MKVPFEQAILKQNEDGTFTLSVTSKRHGNVTATLAPAVTVVLTELIANALVLQIEIEKISPDMQRTFPVKMAEGVIKGEGFFQALDLNALRAQALDGIFGATPAKGTN